MSTTPDAPRCIICGRVLGPNDPAVTTLGPRCAKCWTR
jgi:hypothetical protein